MEICIPLLALGGMYIVTNANDSNINSNKKQNREGMQSYGNESRVQQNRNQSRNEESQQPQTDSHTHIITPTRNETNYDHTNMMPFNGGRVRGAKLDANEESVLDSHIGYGSHYIKKQEQPPLFKPEENISNIHGSENTSDFMQSRMLQNVSETQNGIKPFQGHKEELTGGFNAGMEERDTWEPKTTNDLRIATNPKLEYSLNGHEGPAFSLIQKPTTTSHLGKFEKKLPDRHFKNDQSMWLTTTGAEKATTFRSEEIQKNVQRGDNEVNYKGHAISNKKGIYSQQNFIAPKRQELKGQSIINSNSRGKGPIENHNTFVEGYANQPNNRTTTKEAQATNTGFMGGTMGAVVAPLMDIFRPTYKEEMVDNMRLYGDVKSSVSNTYVTNPYDKTKTTTKETTLYTPESYINNQASGTYLNNQNQLNETHRQTTSIDYNGGAGMNTGHIDYTNAYMHEPSDLKINTDKNRTNMGGTQRFNNNVNVNLPQKQSSIEQTRVNGPFMSNYQTPSVNRQGINDNNRFRETSEQNQSRNDPDLLKEFRNNPYTHSLSSF